MAGRVCMTARAAVVNRGAHTLPRWVEYVDHSGIAHFRVLTRGLP